MSDRRLRVVLALTLLAGWAGVGCGGGTQTKEDTSRPPVVAPEGQEPGAPPPSPETGKAVQVQASSPEMEKIAQELARGRSAQGQQAIYESQRHYEAALMFNNRGDFDKAKIEAQKAVEAWHENIAARKLLNTAKGAVPRSTDSGSSPSRARQANECSEM